MKAETATIIVLLLILLFITGFLLIKRVFRYIHINKQEGFTNSTNHSSTTLDNPDEFYDNYYVKRIDMAYYPQNKNICRCAKLYKEAFHGILPKNKTKVLLIGTNTGRFLDALCGVSSNVTGVTKYELLKEKSQEIAPHANVLSGDITQNPDLFPENTFTHVIFEEREYYQYTKEQRQLALSHIQKWLRPEGLLAIRLVDPDKFDPMIPTAIPLKGVNIQNYLKERRLDSQVRFTDGSKIITHYTPIPSEHRAVFREDLYDIQGTKLRSHIHTWHIPPRDVVLEEVMRFGYSHRDTISLGSCTFPYEYYEIFMNGVPKPI